MCRDSKLCASIPAARRIRKNDRVIPHHIAATNGMHADLARRALADPIAPCRATLSLELAASARIWASVLAVPLGASIFIRWCISTISRSKSGPKISAAFRVSQNSVFTPVEKFEAQTIGIFVLNFKISASRHSVCPVVPMTMAFLCSRAQSRDVRRRRVQTEINHHVPLRNGGGQNHRPRQFARRLAARENFSRTQTSACPIRPFDPVIMMRVIASGVRIP